MNDRHEKSRPAFEAEAESELFSTMRDSHGQYLAALTSVMWQAWCRALDYAAEQQAAPTPLTRPDRPGWWWQWTPDGYMWMIWDIVDRFGTLMASYPNSGKYCKIHDGFWLPTTPPPAPRQTTNQ